MNLLTEKEIKFANNLISESEAADIASVDNKLGMSKRPKKVKEPEDDDDIDDIDENDEFEDVAPFSVEEFCDIIRNLESDEIEYVKMIIADNAADLTIPDISGVINKEELISILSPYFEEYGEDAIILSDCIAYALCDIDSFEDFAYTDELGEITERLINPQHIRMLKLKKKKAAWKADARKRMRFRRTGAGRIMKRKARIYMKKYRRRKKARLKRYGKEYTKFQKRMGGTK